jgi:hypothetical protein
MNSNEIEDLRRRYLYRLYELSGQSTIEEVPFNRIDEDLGISDEDDTKIVMYLQEKNLAGYSTSGHVSITARGIDEVERIMAETYAEKMRMVLKKIYDMSGPPYTNEVIYFNLLRELGMNGRELNPILDDFRNRRGWLGESSDESVCLSPEGVLEVENSRVERSRGGGGDVYQTHIHGPNYGGIQQGGKGNTQNVTLTNTNNPDLDRALASIVELIRSSQIPDDDKQELEDEVGKVNKLALREPAVGLLERAKSRLDMIKLAITGTDIAIKAAPHIETAWELLKHKFGR